MVFSIIVIVLLAAVGVFIYKKAKKPAQITPPAVLTRQVVQQGAAIRKPTGTAPASSVARPATKPARRRYGGSGSSSPSGYDAGYSPAYFASSYDSGSSYGGGSSSSSCDSSSSSSSSSAGGCD